MPCGCGRSYIVNEDYGFSNRRRKKDTSFRSFITFLLLVLLLWVVIYCIILTISNRKGDKLQQSTASKENFHGKIEPTTTNNPWVSNKKTINPYNTYSTYPGHTKLRNDSYDQFEKTTEPQNISIVPIKVDDVTKHDVTLEPLSTQHETITRKQTITPSTDILSTKQENFNNVTENVKINTITTSTINKQTTAVTEPITSTERVDIITAQETTHLSLIKTENVTESNDITTQDVNETTTRNLRVLSTEQSTVIATTNDEDSLGNNIETSTAAFVDGISDPQDIANDCNTTTCEKSYEGVVTKELDHTSTSSSNTYNYLGGIFSQKSEDITTDNSVYENNFTIVTESLHTDKLKEPTTEINTIQFRFGHSNDTVVDEFTTEDDELETSSEITTEKFKKVMNVTKLKSEQTTLFPQVTGATSNMITTENVLDVTTIKHIPEKQKEKIPDNLKPVKHENVCTNAGCKEKAGSILQMMDHSVDPCEDFYQFSCGGARNSDKSEHEEYMDVLLKHLLTFSGPVDNYFKKFRKFINSCIKYENEFGYQIKINQVLSSNVLDNNLTGLLAFLMLRQSTPLFEVRYAFIGGSERYGIQILPPDSSYETTGLKEWSLQNHIKRHCLNFDSKLKYQSEVNLPTVYEDYTKCKEKTFEKMAWNFIMEKLDRTKIPNEKLYGNFITFFSKMTSISSQALQEAILYQKYTKTTIRSLNEKYPGIDWQYFFNKITGGKFEETTPIFLYFEQEYFAPIMSDLKDRMSKTEKDVMETLTLYYQLELYQNLLAPKQNKEQFCLNQATQLMPEIAIKIFYNITGLTNFPSSLVGNIFETLKDDFYRLIEVSHLEDPTKEALQNSLMKLKLKIFSNEDLWMTYLLDSYEKSYVSIDYLSNVFMLIENKRQKWNALYREGEYDLIYTQFLEKQFSPLPNIIPKSDIVAIPNTFLNKLNQTKEYPTYIFETYLKFHLSRTIALHFLENNQMLISGFYRQFLSNLNGYLENGDDINILGQKISYKLDDMLWQKVVQFSDVDRMADNMALDLVFNDIYDSNKTIKSLPWISTDYSPQHQFFLLITQEYCDTSTMSALAQNLYETPNIPSPLRIENMMINSDRFSKTFKCPQGTQMNPEEKTQFENFVANDNSNEYYEANK